MLRSNTGSVREYHSTHPAQRGAAIVLGLGAIAAAAKAGQYAVVGYNEWKSNQPEEPVIEKNKEAAAEDATGAQQKASGDKPDEKTDKKTGEKKRENFFAKFFNLSVGSKYYEGGFEDTMTRREAALILGVRESSTPKRIKEAHRKLLVLNHPDTGGSTYMAGKINEAKELLLKGRRG